jgi:hypothetical protein
MMPRWLLSLWLLAVAAAYAAAFVAIRRAVPFSLDSPWFVFVAMVCVLGLAASRVDDADLAVRVCRRCVTILG